MHPVIGGAGGFADEIIPVPDGLGIEKHAVENERNDTDKAKLDRRIDRSRRGPGYNWA